MKVYQTDINGLYVGSTVADVDPMDKTNYLVPAGCVTDAPPALADGQSARWDGIAWLVVDPPIVPEPVELTIEQIRAGMSCTQLQGKLAIGETLWGEVITYRDTHASWSERMIIDNSAGWHRTSKVIVLLGKVLGVTDLEMDDLFRLAAAL
jgi:hypothetical protein